MTNETLKVYTIKEAAKKINISAGTLRQWEKDLEGLLVIPRSKQGARFYTDNDIMLLKKIKEMSNNNLKKDEIRDLVQKELYSPPADSSEEAKTSITEVITENNAIIERKNQEIKQLFAAMESFKDQLLSEVKEEIRTGIRKEVLDEVKKEISKGSVHTVKKLSDSIYKSGEKTMNEIEELTGQLQKASEQTSATVGNLSKRIAKASKNTSEQLRNLTNHIEDSSEAAAEEFKTMIHYISSSAEVTHTEISSLIDTLNKDREFYLETMNREREQYWEDVNKREAVFQDLIVSFRAAAAANEKKQWWKFWQ